MRRRRADDDVAKIPESQRIDINTNTDIDINIDIPRSIVRRRSFILVAVGSLVLLSIVNPHSNIDNLLQTQDKASSTSSSSSGSSSSSSKNKKPVFILHVGPPKTGSTTLQCTLESLRTELVQDGIAYIGRPECRGYSNSNISNIHIDAQTKREFRLFESALVSGYSCQKELIAMEEEKEKGEVEVDLEQHNHNNNDQQDTNSTVTYPACWDEFIHRLESYRQNTSTSSATSTTHVVFSDEAMSNRIARTRAYRPSLPYPFQSLKRMLEEDMGWDVKVLIVHRPLYDYLPSVYVEQYKDGPGKRRLRQWFGGPEPEPVENHDHDHDHSTSANNITSSCPFQGGRAVPRPFHGIPEYDTSSNKNYEITISNLLQRDQNLYPTPAQVYEIFRQHGFTTVLVDMKKMYKYKYPIAIGSKSGNDSGNDSGKEKSYENGQEEDINFIQHIICNIFPDTVHTCEALLRRDDDSTDNEEGNISSSTPEKKVTVQLNPSLSLHYDFIAVEACQRSLFHGNTTGRDVARLAIQQRQEAELGLSPNDFPLLCPEEEVLKKILEMSLEHEDRLVLGDTDGQHAGTGTGNTSTSTRRRIKSSSSSISSSISIGDIDNDESRRSRRHSYENLFWKVVHEKKRFCTVDSRRVIQDEDWITFFSRLNE
mmetsp:Transcript_8245/g.11715  ORF Transcript_8245/g.11715 Transcript_8245/m.11715 type:complete len:653 (-) Transcript_8245:125-2083(-)